MLRSSVVALSSQIWLLSLILFFSVSSEGSAASMQSEQLTLPLSVSIWLLQDRVPESATKERRDDDTLANELVENLSDILMLTNELEENLSDILPFYAPAIPGIDGEVTSSMLMEISYHVVSATDTNSGSSEALKSFQKIFMKRYRDLIYSSKRDAHGRHVVDVAAVITLLSELEEMAVDAVPDSKRDIPVELLRASLLHLPLLVLPTDVRDGNGQKYMLVGPEGECTQNVVAGVAFYDQGAMNCDILTHISRTQAEDQASVSSGEMTTGDGLLGLPLSRTHHIRGHLLSFEESDDMVQHQMHKQMEEAAKQGAGGSAQKATLYARRHISTVVGAAAVRSLTVRTAAIVTSAVHSFASASTLATQLAETTTIVVPVIVLKCSQGDDSMPVDVDTSKIQSWVQNLVLPDQRVIIVTHEHTLNEHPQLAVAVASSRRTFEASGESIPYLDSSILVEELAAAGDPLCTALLHKTGLEDLWVGEASSQVPWYQRNAEGSEDAANYLLTLLQKQGYTEEGATGDTSAAHESQAQAAAKKTGYKSKHTKTPHVGLLPIFIISDMFEHGDNDPDGKGSVPLLDKDDHFSIQPNLVLAMHYSGNDPARTYNRATQQWQGVRKDGTLTDMTTLVAAALTQAFTGVQAPYMQIYSPSGYKSGRGVLDFTWTHGVHPFEFGSLGRRTDSKPGATEDSQQIYHWLGKRSALGARVHLVLDKARHIAKQARQDVEEVRRALSMLHLDIESRSKAQNGADMHPISLLLQARNDVGHVSANDLSDALEKYVQTNRQWWDIDTSNENTGDRQGEDALRSLMSHVVAVLKGAESVDAAVLSLQNAFRRLSAGTNGEAPRRAMLKSILSGEAKALAVESLSRREAAKRNRLTRSLEVQYQNRHSTPYEMLQRSLITIEKKVSTAANIQTEMRRSLYKLLGSCKATFHFVDNAAYSLLGQRSATAGDREGHIGMVSDFKLVVERSERTRVSQKAAEQERTEGSIGVASLVWHYFSGTTPRDYGNDAELRKHRESITQLKDEHLQYVIDGYRYDDSNSHDGRLTRIGSQKANSSQLLRMLTKSSTGQAVGGLLLLISLVAVPLYLRRSREILEKRAKKTA